MELNNTAVVILLVLNRAPRSGYEVKQFIDSSARHFWAASYGRIYPELKRLTHAGLIEGSDDSQGARAKTSFALTDAGREALGEWYAREPEILELRDEAMLKIFFGGAFDKNLVAAHIEARRRNSERVLAELRSMEPKASAHAAADPFPYETLRCGLAMHESVIAWCDSAQKELIS